MKIEILTLSSDRVKNQNKLVKKAEKISRKENLLINSYTYIETVNHPYIPFLNIAKGEFRYYNRH